MNEGEVHVWCAWWNTGSAHSRRFDDLSTDELERAERFHFARDGNRFAVACSTLRRILGRYLQLDPAVIAFSYTRFGKPELAEPHAGLKFNAAHSDALAVYAVGLRCEAGIDVERLRPIAEAE